MKHTLIAVLACLVAVTAAQAAALADKHIAKGLQCAVCHGPDQKNLQEPTTETCTACHNVKALVAKTKNVKPANPHFSHLTALPGSVGLHQLPYGAPGKRKFLQSVSPV